MAQRIYFPRGVKGWRKPPDSVVVTRSSNVWGNPFTVKDHGRAEAIRLYTEWIRHGDQVEGKWDPAVARARLPELVGRDLVCQCKPGEACHADVLIEMAAELAD